MDASVVGSDFFVLVGLNDLDKQLVVERLIDINKDFCCCVNLKLAGRLFSSAPISVVFILGEAVGDATRLVEAREKSGIVDQFIGLSLGLELLELRWDRS